MKKGATDRLFWGLAVTAICLAILGDREECIAYLQRIVNNALVSKTGKYP